MERRPFRIALVLLGLLITAGLGYGVLQDERALDRERRERAAIDQSAETAVSALADLRAALHAYVAPGQGLAFWSARSAASIDAIREQLAALDMAVAGSGGSFAESLDGVDQLTAAEKRALAYAGRGEALLAGDIIFTEIRDLLTTTEEKVRAGRATFGQDHDRRLVGRRLRQAGFVAGALVLWIVLALVLLPVQARTATGAREWRQQLAEALKTPTIAPRDPEALRRGGGDVGAEPHPIPSAEATVSLAALKRAGEICADLSTLSDASALAGSLAQACTVLDASGVIVWVASNDGHTLSPVAAHGYDPRLVARVGTIRRDSSNITAAAFRENTAQISPATATAAAALAVSLRGPSGPVGVLSAELRTGRAPDDTCVALAVIFAAQLATLTAPAPAAARTESADDGSSRTAVR